MTGVGVGVATPAMLPTKMLPLGRGMPAAKTSLTKAVLAQALESSDAGRVAQVTFWAQALDAVRARSPARRSFLNIAVHHGEWVGGASCGQGLPWVLAFALNGECAAVG